jgi:hypothetical protein
MCHVAYCAPKSPFRPHFGAFYPHSGSKSALRCGRGDPLFGTPETWRLEPGCRVVLWLSPNGAAVVRSLPPRSPVAPA